MKLKAKRIPAVIAAILTCALISACALAEVHPENNEANGKIKETVWKDDAGQITAGPDGYAMISYNYKGKETTEKYYDAEGRPYRTDGGYYGRTVEKEGKGRVTRIDYLDENGALTLNSMGYASVNIEYHSFGEVRMVMYKGLNRKAVIVPSLGYASVLNEYSGKIMKSRTYRDAKGNPVDNAQGYAVVRQNIKKAGGTNQVLSIRYDHADGSPAAGPDGWWRCVKDRDEKGRLVSVKYYGVNEQLTDRGAGYAWEGYAYEGDNIVKITRYDLNDEPVADSAGVATVVQETKDGQVTRERFLDADGNRTVNELGVGEIQYGYDLQGSIEKVTYLDLEGSPVNCNKGYAGYRDTKDEDGATVTRNFLGTDGTPTDTADGYSEIRYAYDETKAIVSIRYFDVNGQQVQTK